MADVTCEALGKVVMRYGIIGTETVVYEAWEDYDGHSTYRTEGERKLGRVGTRRLTDELEALPKMSRERSERVRDWHDDQYQEAYDAIFAAFPELRAEIPFGDDENGGPLGYGSMGSVTVFGRAITRG